MTQLRIVNCILFNFSLQALHPNLFLNIYGKEEEKEAEGEDSDDGYEYDDPEEK